MSDNLRNFLLTLVEDLDKLEHFRNDPEGVMQEAGLPDQDREVLRSNNPQTIREYLGEQEGTEWIVFTWIFYSAQD